LLLIARAVPAAGALRWQHRRQQPTISLRFAMVAAGNADQQGLANGDPISEEEALRRLRLTDDPSAQYYAAWWLGRNRSTHPDAVPLLILALRQRCPRDPAAGVEANAVARNAARALGKLGHPARAAIDDLLATLEDPDHGLREAAARSLGELRAEVAVEPLRRRLASGPAVAGAQQAGSPRLLEPCEALLEALGQIGIADAAVLAVIEPFVQHERPLIRSAAFRALLQLTADERWGRELVALLQHPQLQVRRAALMDLGAAGWHQALEPIAATLAENSLKLIALRGLAEMPCAHPHGQATEAVLDAMDALL
jgi:phycocyanobilin lyase alpha subunit